MNDIKMLSSKAYDRMEKNGWYMVSIRGHADQKQKEQMEKLNIRYNNIKKYYMTTYVRGFYKEVWACKIW